MISLSGIAVITGGGRGIGRAIALSFAQAGADVAVLGRTAAPLEQVREECLALGVRALAIPCDVADTAAVRAAFAAIRGELGPVDILVNNAGITASVKFAETDDATWERVMRVNVTGPFVCCREVVPTMIERGGGRIINIASIAALNGIPYSSAYSASKHALLGLTRSLALELARNGITANAICPGWVETDMLADTLQNIVAKTGRSAEDALASVLAISGQPRVITPDEVAAVALRLAGPDGAQTNGEAIVLA
ncbi:MAG: SDR family oxidoreductase [Roseiflexaceae bacterium]|nr:SDR family oxidoreductase [Roseiflexaceae bacterium]